MTDEWKEIPKETIDEYTKKLASQTGTQPMDFVVGFQKKFERDFQYPYVLVQQHKMKTPTYDQLLKEFDQATPMIEDLSRQYSMVIKNASMDKPVLDKERNILFFNMTIEVTGVGEIKGLIAMFLGKKGITQLNCYSAKFNYSKNLPIFEEMIDSFKYDEGYMYGSTKEIGVAGFLENLDSNLIIGGLIGLILILIIFFAFLFKNLYSYEK